MPLSRQMRRNAPRTRTEVIWAVSVRLWHAWSGRRLHGRGQCCGHCSDPWPGSVVRERYQMLTLRGATMGVIGLGGIGQEVARLSRGAGMRVIGTRRSRPELTGLPQILQTPHISGGGETRVAEPFAGSSQTTSGAT